MRIGYARVSTNDQSFDIQLEELKKAGCEKIYVEKISGNMKNRPEFDKMMENFRAKDVLVVTKLDRLARSTRNLLDIIENLNSQSVDFHSLSEPWADTTSHAGRMVMTIFVGIAEFERSLIVDRTHSGREAAKNKGVKFGRPIKLTKQQVLSAKKMLGQDSSVRDVADTLMVNRSTIYRMLDKLAV